MMFYDVVIYFSCLFVMCVMFSFGIDVFLIMLTSLTLKLGSEHC